MQHNQGSDEWFSARLGRVTASRVADLMAKTKSGYSTSRANYMMELLCQRLTGKREEGYTNSYMLRGIELEPLARSAYEVATGVSVCESGFIDHPFIANFGASPDGLCGDDGLLEIKCPLTANHIEFMRSKKPDGKYIIQMQAQMECTGRKWCDFVSFDDRLPDALQYRSVRVFRDHAFAAEMVREVRSFLEELDELESEMLLEIERVA